MPDERPDPEGDVGWNMVMPLVLCEDQGGPFDAAAVVAGYTVAQWAAIIEMAGTIGVSTFTTGIGIDRRLIPQLDLFAMRHGYRIEVADSEIPEYAYLTVTRTDPN